MGALREAVGSLLVHTGVDRVARFLARRRCAILAYHNIVPDGTRPGGDRSLHLERSRFAAQLDLLTDAVDVVPLEALIRSDAEDRGRPRIAVTFDDAYRGAVTLGVDELAKRELPATIFVAPGLVGGRTLWWDELAGRGEGGLPPDVRRRALGEFRGRDSEIRQWAQREGLDQGLVGEHAATATEDELGDAVRRGGITLASHSWSHLNLTALDTVELQAELVNSLAWLRARFSPMIPWIAYPYGLSSAAVQRAAALAGYAAGVTVSAGWLRSEHADPFALPRMNVPAGISSNRLRLKLGGMWHA